MVEHVALCVCPTVVQLKQDRSVRELRVCVDGVVTGEPRWALEFPLHACIQCSIVEIGRAHV